MNLSSYISFLAHFVQEREAHRGHHGAMSRLSSNRGKDNGSWDLRRSRERE